MALSSDSSGVLPLVGDLGVIYQSPIPADSGSGGSTGGSPAPVSGSGSGLTINVIYDSSVNDAPAGFKTAIQDAVQYLESVITTPITVNIDVGYGEIDGQALQSGALGESETYLENYGYSSIKTALANVGPAAASNLPSSAPGTMWLATAQAKALGLAAASNDIDAYAGFSNIYPFTYDPNNRAVAGEYDFIGVVEHEFTEDMGRIDLFGEDIGDTPNSYSLLDLYHYTSSGVHTYTGTTLNYLSVNGGTTALDYFNSNPNGDLGDWAASAGNDSFLAFTPTGQEDVVSQADILAMNALGYQTLTQPTVTATSQTVADNQSVALANIFSVSGNNITQYQVWFSDPQLGAPALGTVTNNGTPIALDQAVTLTTLSGLEYTGSASAGTDEIWLKAFNGVWTNWVLADITDPGIPPAVVTATNQTVADNQSVALTNIFSVSGSSITQYQVWFSDPQLGAPALGTVTDNGTPIALNQAMTLTTLSGLEYAGSASAGTDEIWLKAFDGVWTNWALADITDPGIPPAEVTATSQTVADNQSVALTNIFSASGSGITQYQVWFSDPQLGAPALGTVTNNGTPIALNQAVTLTTLSGLEYTGSASAGTDEIWLKAFDGVWTNWVLADITDPGIPPAEVTATSQTVADNQSVVLTNIFSASGSGISQYQVWFSDPQLGAPALGTVTNNGSPIALDRAVTLTTLSGLEYTGSATAGTDQIWLKAFDGVWTNWVLADITNSGANASLPSNASVSTDGVAIPNLIAVSANDTVELGNGSSGNVIFAATTGTLQFDNSLSFAGTVAALAGHDAIDLRDIDFTAKTRTSYLAKGATNGGTLSVGDGVHIANIALLGNYLASTFVASSDGHGGTLVSEQQMASQNQPLAASVGRT
jgi:membrane-bound inhibitor of C-type lysozyme